LAPDITRWGATTLLPGDSYSQIDDPLYAELYIE
jgi:hypothetical protein